MEFDATIKPRPELAPDWYEVSIDDAVFLEAAFPPGTQINTGGMTLETIEEAMPGCPVMCRLVADNRHAAELLAKYAEEPPPKKPARWMIDYIVRRLTRR